MTSRRSCGPPATLSRRSSLRRRPIRAWIVCAHGAHFEDAIERYVLHPRFDWPVFPIEQQRCTQAMALAVGLPARLSLAAIALELSNRKDAAGERLMHQTSKPRRSHKDEDPTKVYWLEDAGRLQRLGEYCRQDVEVERELFTTTAAAVGL